MAAVTQEAQIEQFLREGAGATGRAAADLVERAVSAPGLFAFGELLDLDGVQRLAADPSLAGHLALLKLFAHGKHILLLLELQVVNLRLCRSELGPQLLELTGLTLGLVHE